MSNEEKKHVAAALPGQVVVAAGKTNTALGAKPPIPAPSKPLDAPTGKTVIAQALKEQAAVKGISPDPRPTAVPKPAAAPKSRPAAKPKAAPAKKAVSGAKPSPKPSKEALAKLDAIVKATMKKVDAKIAAEKKAKVKAKSGIKPASKALAGKPLPKKPQAAKKAKPAKPIVRDKVKDNARNRERYEKDGTYRDKVLDRAAAWRKENKVKISAYNVDRKKDAHYQGTTVVRNFITGGLSRPKVECGPKRNTKKFQEIVGCTREAFQKHIESQFKPGMTWDNFRKSWTFAFKKKLGEFDLSKPDQVKQAANFKNVVVVSG